MFIVLAILFGLSSLGFFAYGIYLGTSGGWYVNGGFSPEDTVSFIGFGLCGLLTIVFLILSVVHGASTSKERGKRLQKKAEADPNVLKMEGQGASNPSKNTLRCPDCGTENSADATECKHCHRKLR